MNKGISYVEHITNPFEDTLVFKVGSNTLDICHLKDRDDVIIALSDQFGEDISSVTIEPAMLSEYLSGLGGMKTAC